MQWDVIIREVKPKPFDSKENIEGITPADLPLSQIEISKRATLYSKAIYSFYCALASIEYKKI